ncbi:diguanylate cyclase domain-containing protein [Malaciobacter marinus]|uniref:diguanylate cyclase domain-containing protein n=1 Tax=Malaciobacter marinus TaxID=505249 RepID=UPI0009A91426|nr:diguanylate cyclase [Malaciobacter marinus]SKB82052.1 PAS domain S-box-containing protein/diguanylate cyclase (GGDEF) domain-containing protein [Malaciobacter marinus]
MKAIFIILLLFYYTYAQNIENLLIDKKFNTNLTTKELDFLKTHNSLNLCIDPDWMPLEKFEKDEYIGITSDYMKILQKRLGIKIKAIKSNSWSQSLEYGKQRKCDIFSLVMPTKSREEYLNFTEPYITIPLVLITKIEKLYIANLKKISKKVGIVKDYAFTEQLKKDYPNLEIVEVENLKTGLNKVKNNKLFGFIDTVTAAGYQIQQQYFGELKITAKFDNAWDLSIGTRNDMPLLKSIFNKALTKISQEEHQIILNKWISIKYETNANYGYIFRWIGAISIFFFTIIFIIIKANRKLNKEITNRRKIEKELKSYIKIVDENIISATTDLKGNILHVSNAFCKVSKYTKKELIGKTHSILKHESMDKKVYKELWETISKDKIWQGEIKNKTKQGDCFWVKAIISPTFNEDGIKVGYTSIKEDITTKKKLERLSITDELTKTYNKRYFNELMPKLLNSIKRKNEYITFSIFDIDYFKPYNDTYGHLKGDNALKEVTKEVMSNLNRADDFCFRLGGEEFGIVFKDSNPEKSKEFLEKIKNSIENLKIPHENNKVSPYVTASFGYVCTKAEDIDSVDILYKKADEQLYKAKENGRNIVLP